MKILGGAVPVIVLPCITLVISIQNPWPAPSTSTARSLVRIGHGLPLRARWVAERVRILWVTVRRDLLRVKHVETLYFDIQFLPLVNIAKFKFTIDKT